MPFGAIFELTAHSGRQPLHGDSTSIQPFLQITFWRRFSRPPTRHPPSTSTSGKCWIPIVAVSIAPSKMLFLRLLLLLLLLP